MTTGHVGLLGGGVIGGGWAARFLLNGHDVVMFDPDPEAPRKVGEVLANARRANARLTSAQWPAEGSLRIVTTVEEAVDGAHFVQESAPERLELKQQLFAAASRVAGARRGVRIVDVGSAAHRDAARHGPPRTARGRPSVQPGVPHAAGRGVRWRRDIGSHQAARRRDLPQHRHAPPDPLEGDRRIRRRPLDGSAVARGVVAGQRRRGDGRRDRRCNALRARPALELHGHVPDLSHRRRRGRNAALHGPVRAGVEMAVDEVDGRARADRRTARHASARRAMRRSTCRRPGCRSASWKRCATTVWSRSCTACATAASPPARRLPTSSGRLFDTRQPRSPDDIDLSAPIRHPRACRAHRLGRLQRPHQRQPLHADHQRGRRSVHATDRGRRAVPAIGSARTTPSRATSTSSPRATPAITCTSPRSCCRTTQSACTSSPSCIAATTTRPWRPPST